MASISREKVTALSRQPNKQFKTWLIGKLAEIGMAQQANVDSATLEYFSEMLAVYDPSDLLPALKFYCHRKREPGETAFPSLPMLEATIVDERNKRIKAERAEREREDAAIKAKHVADNPDEYIHFSSFKELLKTLEEARIAKKASR
jgi:hypothetical protein